MRFTSALRASAVAFAILALPAAAAAQFVIGPGPGGAATVHLIDGATTRTVDIFDPRFLGGVSVTLGDVNGDGTADIIGGAGPGGGPHVRVLSGIDFTQIASFIAYDPAFTGGVSVAAGDVNGDGHADIITGAGAGGGPHVIVFSGTDLSILASFFAYDPAFIGGVSVAAGDVNGDGNSDIITGAGAGGGSHVEVFSGADLSILASFLAYDPAFTGGVSVAAGDINGDGNSDIITGAGAGGGPHVEIFSGADLSVLESFWAYDPAFGGGVHVAAGDVNGDGVVDVILGAGPGGGPHVRVLSGVDLSQLASFFAPGTGSGVSVGSVGDASGVRFTSASATSFLVGSAESFTITTAGNPPPAITSSGTLPAGVTLVDNGDGTATLSGTPAAGTGGDYPLMFTADNGTGTPATQDFTLTVDEPPAITSPASATFPIGAAGSFTVTTSGFPPPAITRGGVSLPAGVTFVDNGDGTGTLSGTPAAGTGGTYALTFTASNGVGVPAVQTFTLTVNGAPAFTSANTITFTVGSLGTFTVTTVASPTAAISLSGALPAGVSFVDNGDGTGTLSGTPAPGTGGARALTFTATNGILPNAVQSFTLNVNAAPAITSANSATFTVGAAGSFTVTTSGFPPPSIARGGVNLPAGLAFVDNANGTGTLSGTPAAGTGGAYAITFTATNSSGSSPAQSFTLTVNQGPAITSANTTTFTVGGAGAFMVMATGSPTPALTVTGALPAGVTFLDNGNGTGTLSGTPAAGTGGTYAITFTASNGVLPNASQAFTLNVNQAPAITSANSTAFVVGAAGSFTVTTSGFPVPSIARGGASLPGGVTFVDNGNGTGTLTGTPAAATGGTYALTFTAINSGGSSPAQAFTLTVNEAPAITSANTVNFTVGAAGSFTVTTLGLPVPAIARGGVALPSGVTFVDNGDGTATLSGTPAAGTGGTYAITFTATNSVGSSPVQAFTLTITEALTITSANATTFLAATPGSFTVTTTGFPVPTLTLTAGTLPAGVTFTDNGDGTATLSGTATATGVFTLEFTADNGSAPAVQSFTLTVNQAPTFTSANATTFTEDVAGTFTVTTEGTPTPALSATGALPAGVTFTDNGNGTATLAGTAAAGGTFPLTITADNGVGGSVTQAFTLTVNEVNDAPSFVIAGDPAAVTEDAGPQTIAAFATAISPGPANEAGQLLTFVVQNNSNPGLFSIAPAVSAATGALTYTSGTNAFGTATITLVLQDNGGTANGGVNTSAPQMFTITVLPVNDPPLVVNETFQLLGNTELRVDMPTGTTPHTSETTAGVSAVEGVLDNDGDPEGDPITVTAIANCTVPDTTAPFDCTLTGGAVVHVAANGEFSYTPAPGATTGSFTYTVTDTPAQGTAASVSGTVTFTIVEMVWYVKNDGAAGTGTSRAPLNAMTTLNGAGGAGDVDDGNDYIFVDFGDGTSTGQVGGLELEIGQQLIGEFTGLSVPVNLNGNGSPTVVVPTPGATDCSGGPCRPLIGQTTGNALSVTEAMPATIRGFRLAGGSAGNAIDVTTDGALTGSATLTIADNIFQGAGLEGIDVNLIAGTTGTLALTVLGNIWDNAAAHAGNAIDISRLAGALNLTLSSNLNIESAANAVVIDGGSAASTNIVGFINNTVHTDTVLAGMLISNVTFDAVPGGGVDPVAAGVLTIGVDGNGVGAAGLTLTNVRGNLGFTDLDVYGTSGLTVTGDAALGVALTVVPPGSGGSSEAKGTSGPAVAITNAAINLQFAELASTFVSGSGVSLTTVGGTFSAPSGSTIVKNGGGGAAFTVNNSAAGTTVLTATYAGTITNTSGIGGSVSVTSADAGSAVSFTGAITDNPGTGISLASNTGATVSFSGGLTLNGANSRFAATGGGTVSVTGTNTIGATTAPSGPALNVANTTIGASGLTFRSISANGGANGIVLNNTGGTGSLTVSGNGGTCTSVATCTGGAVQNTTGDGLALTSTSNVSLTRIFVGATGNHGINASAVNGLTMTSTLVQNAGDADNEHGLNLVNVTGTVTINGAAFSGASEDLVHLENNNTNVTFNVTSGSQFSYPAVVGALANSAMLLLPGGTASITASIQNSTFTNVRNAAAQIGANLLNSNGTQNFTFSNNTLNVALAGRASGVVVSGQELTTTNITIANNTFSGAGGNGVISIDTNDSSRVQGTVSGNQITNPPGIGMFVAVDEAATNDIVFDNNTITNSGGDGIQAVNFGGVGVSTMQLAVTNNVVNGHSANTAVNFVGGISFTGFEDTSCLVLRGNTVTGTPVGPTQCGGAPCVDYYVEEVGGTMTLEEVPNTAATTASAAYVNSINDAGPVTVFGVIDLTNGATCNVALMADGGERPACSTASAPAVGEDDLTRLVLAAARSMHANFAGASDRAPIADDLMTSLGLRVTDLAAGQLGRVAGRHISLDRNAAGWGWFVDPTPDQDEEFEPASSGNGERHAKAGGPADGRIDLLTVLMHEMGHARGDSDLDSIAHAGELMAARLKAGVRRRPTAVEGRRQDGGTVFE